MVFTLGSAAVLAAGNFYEVSARAAIGWASGPCSSWAPTRATARSLALPSSICVAEYAPYSALFSRSALIVHQGGVGTTAQCLRAGKPMLIMPYSHDQPDNARRMRRLKVAQARSSGRITSRRAWHARCAQCSTSRSLRSARSWWPGRSLPKTAQGPPAMRSRRCSRAATETLATVARTGRSLWPMSN